MMNLHTKPHELKRIFVVKQLTHLRRQLATRITRIAKKVISFRANHCINSCELVKFVSKRAVQFRVEPHFGKFPVTPHRYA
jgi:hypothetical protein